MNITTIPQIKSRKPSSRHEIVVFKKGRFGDPRGNVSQEFGNGSRPELSISCALAQPVAIRVWTVTAP